MFDLKKLNDIDIKDIQRSLANIDTKTLQDDLMKRKDIVLNIVLILSTFFGAQFLWSNTQRSITQMKKQTAELEEKSQTILNLEEEKQRSTNFLDKFPQGFSGFTAVIDRVSILADQTNVTIISFVPKAPQETDLLTTHQVEFSVTTSSYTNMIQFIQNIESSQENMRVNSWTVSPEQQRAQDKQQKMIYKILISSIELKNEK